MLFGEFAKSQAEAEYPELWNGLVGAWAPCLSPRGGTVLRDLSGRKNHGTLTNMDAETDWVTSGGRQALDFDGTDDYVVTANTINISGSAARTLSIFVNLRSISNQTLFGWGAPSNNNWWNVSIISGNWYVSGYLNDYDTGVGVTTGVRHVVASYNGIDLNVYVDGKAIGSTTKTYATTATQGKFAARDFPGIENWLNASMYDVVLLNRNATHDDAKLLYRLGPGGWATPRRRRWNYVAASQLTNRRRRLLFSAR